MPLPVARGRGDRHATMQYVGRFVSTVYNTITPNINPATLSGAIDVIVVERQIEVEEEVPIDVHGNPIPESEPTADTDQHNAERLTKKVKVKRTELASSPFHVRFGKMSVLRPAERKVTLHLNNATEPLPFAMKVADSGEAFFVLEIDSDEEVPDDLVTSPILSAASSPITSPESPGTNAANKQDGAKTPSRSETAEVEPLDLGESRATLESSQDSDEHDNDARSTTNTIRSSSTAAETNITIPSTGRSSSADPPLTSKSTNSKEKLKKDDKQPDDADDTGDLNVPDDSGLSGSGPAAGTSSLLERVGNAASKASGAIGAAGRAALGAPRLEQVADDANGQQDQQTGAEVDTDRGDAHKYDPQQGGPEGKQRQQDDEQVSREQQPRNETERLEQQLRDRSMRVIHAEAEQDRLNASALSSAQHDAPMLPADQEEESYPEPFGTSHDVSHSADALVKKSAGRGITRAGSETFPVATSKHSEYLGGKRLKPIPSGLGDNFIEPAMVDASSYLARERSRESRTRTPDDSAVRQDEAVDDEEEDEDADTQRAVKLESRKEDLQYMLDMDGYKMTADGEELAFQEGNRLADEMPLSKRHGGHGRHGHPERLNGPGHNHKVSLPGTSSASLRRRSGTRAHRPSISVDYRKKQGVRADRRDRSGSVGGPLGQLDISDLDEPDNEPGTVGSGTGTQSSTTFEQDEASLTRDLARLARLNRASESNGDRMGRSQAKFSASQQGLRRHASLSNRSPSGRASPSARGSRRERRNKHRHFQEFSLSDTEAEFHSARNVSRRASMDASQESIKASSSASQLAPFLRDLRVPMDDAIAPVIVPDTSDAHLGSSSNLSWQWGEPSPRGPLRRARFASTDGYEARTTESAAAAAALDKLSQDDSALAGKLSSAEWEPYLFHLELQDTVHTFELSLCNKEGFGRNGDVDVYEFEENRVSFQRFVDDEELVNDERLVVRYNERFLTWENASTVLATLSLYRKTLGQSSKPESTKDGPEEPRSSRASYWSRWFGRSSKSIPDLKQASAEQELQRAAAEPKKAATASTAPLGDNNLLTPAGHSIERANTDTILATNQLVATPDTTEPQKTLEQRKAATEAKANSDAKRNKMYAKTLRLNSDQLKSLNLRKGANTITFSVTSSYSGVATCTARIFLWESSHKIVVSDIDGTITKSDALGHVFTMIGRDWTHLGVAKLYTDIARNGYRIMYLTSRAIGQADTTRDYLKGIRQNNYQLPDGPVIMSPDRLIASLHREVILRKPEVFKMACLRDIARLFGADPRTAQAQPGGHLSGVDEQSIQAAKGQGAGGETSPGAGAATAIRAEEKETEKDTGSVAKASVKKEDHATPFYAGFGNRITDALSYRSVNIPSSRIFTIDSNGEVKMELLELAGYKSSYIHMTDLVDQMFPPITAKEEKEPRKPEFNDFNFWRPSIAEVELPPDDELLGTPPVSPALSARSGKSVRSLRSVKSMTSDGGGTIASEPVANEKPGRLSRFGLGSLSLSRKGSTSTMPATMDEGHMGPGAGAGDEDRLRRAASAEPDFAPSTSPPSSSYGSSWAAPWRRSRATSPTATSPLVGPAISAEPESEDEQFVDSDDDVSSFGGGRSRLNSEEPESEDEGEVMDFAPRSSRNRSGEGEDEDEDDEDEDEDEDEDGAEEDDDPLLATGEIRFDWQG